MFYSLVHGYYIYVGFLAQICRLHWSISFFLTALLTENLVKSVNAEILLHSRYANMQINSMICISSDYKYDAIFGELVCRDASILICLVCCYSYFLLYGVYVSMLGTLERISTLGRLISRYDM